MRTVKIGLIGIGMVAVSVLLLLFFGLKSPNKTASNASVPNKALLGKWVCIADNVSEHPTATMDFKEDGTVVLADKDRDPLTIHYKTRSAKEFWAERLKNLRAKVPNLDQSVPDMEGPDGEVIMFADHNGNFTEGGFNLLFFDLRISF